MMEHKFGLIIITKGFAPFDSKIAFIMIANILKLIYHLRQEFIIGDNGININDRLCP